MTGTLTPRQYFDAAFGLLEDEGFLGLKQVSLCARLGVTTGSFYYHFANWQDFREQLLRDWFESRTSSLMEIVDSTDDPWERVQRLRQQMLLLPRRAEAAIRAWSRADPDVATFQREVDDKRTTLASAAMTDLVGDAAEGRRFALAGMYILTGWESLEQGDPEQLDWTLQALLATVPRVAPS